MKLALAIRRISDADPRNHWIGVDCTRRL